MFYSIVHLIKPNKDHNHIANILRKKMYCCLPGSYTSTKFGTKTYIGPFLLNLLMIHAQAPLHPRPTSHPGKFITFIYLSIVVTTSVIWWHISTSWCALSSQDIGNHVCPVIYSNSEQLNRCHIYTLSYLFTHHISKTQFSFGIFSASVHESIP